MDWYEVADPEIQTEKHRCTCERCLACHVHGKHDWTDWTCFPLCEWCEGELYDWINDNVDDPWASTTKDLTK